MAKGASQQKTLRAALMWLQRTFHLPCKPENIPIQNKTGDSNPHSTLTDEQKEILYGPVIKKLYREHQLAAQLQYELAARIQDVANLKYECFKPKKKS